MEKKEQGTPPTSSAWGGRPSIGWSKHWYCPMNREHDVTEAERRFAKPAGEIREVGEMDMQRGYRITCVTSLVDATGRVTLSFEPILCPQCRATLRQVFVPDEKAASA